jgi:hypothetical protein
MSGWREISRAWCSVKSEVGVKLNVELLVKGNLLGPASGEAVKRCHISKAGRKRNSGPAWMVTADRPARAPRVEG